MFQQGHTPQQTFASALEVSTAQNALVYISEQHRDIQDVCTVDSMLARSLSAPRAMF
jgi:hypothetical protein